MVVEATALHRRVFWKTSAGVTAQQRWSRLHGREKDHLPADSHTRPLPRSGIRSGTRGDAASGEKNKKGRGDMSITVRASPSGVSHLSSTPQPAGVQLDRAGTSAE